MHTFSYRTTANIRRESRRGTVKQRDKPPKAKRKFCPKKEKVAVEKVQVMIAFFFLGQQLADIWRESGLRQGRSDARRLVDARCEQAARVQVYIHICIYILIAEPLVCSSFLLVLKVD